MVAGQPPITRNSHPLLKGLGLALMVIIPIIAIQASGGGDPEAAGERAGSLSVAPFLAGIAVGIWAKLAKRRWRWSDYGLRFALATIVFFALNAVGRGVRGAATPESRSVAVPLTEAEKQGLYVSGGWVNHRELGFVLPVGGTWDAAPDVQNEINSRLAGFPGAYAWALQKPDRDEFVLVYVMKGLGTTEAEFRAMARGVGTGFQKQGVQVLEDVLDWSRRAKEFRYSVRMTDGRYGKTRCVPSGSSRTPYVICVQTVSPDSTGLDDARSHLRITARQ